MGVLSRALLLALVASSAWAHSDGAAGDPGAAVELRLEPGDVQLALSAQTASFEGRSDEDLSFIESVEQVAIGALFAFSPLRALTLVVQVPVVHRRWAIATFRFPPIHVRSTGLGDTEVGARYLLLDSGAHALAISAGASMPTGDNSAQQDALRLDEHAQLGRGSVGPHATLLYVFERRQWTIAASVMGKYQLRNGWDYQYAPTLGWQVRAGYSHARWLSLALGIEGRYAGNDLDGRVVYQHTGGLALLLNTMVKVKLFGHAAVTAAVQVPLYERLNGDQQLGPAFSVGLEYLVQ